MGKQGWCDECRKTYDRDSRHACVRKCTQCFLTDANQKKTNDNVICCDECSCDFGQKCYNKHLRDRSLKEDGTRMKNRTKRDIVCDCLKW